MSTWRVLTGDCRESMRTLAAESVQCCVTSPPYWGLRDYGHADQIGLEATPGAYVAGMVDVFREVRRVLRVDATLWLNIGDSYATPGTRQGDRDGGVTDARNEHRRFYRSLVPGLKNKDMAGIPWRLAFALQADGWYLRSDIIWAKPNPMPESVTDRPTKAHEYLFLLSKSERYFYDADAIREPATWGAPNSPESIKSPHGQGFTRRNNPEWQKQRAETNEKKGCGNRNAKSGGFTEWQPENGRNARSVWTISTVPYAGAHFATFPPELAERCIKAGSSQKGACSECGSPWERERESLDDDRTPYRTEGAGDKAGSAGRNDGKGLRKVLRDDGRGGDLATKRYETTGWAPSCECNAVVVPCVVLDPFAGSGTTGMVATGHGRSAILCELNPEYVPLIRERCGPMLEGAA